MTPSIRKLFAPALGLISFLSLHPMMVYAQSLESNAAVFLDPSHASPKHGTVSAASLRIPEKAKRKAEKARDELCKGHEDKSMEYVNSALAVAPNYAEALTTRGIINLVQDRPAEAVKDFEQAIHADPDEGLAYLVMGCALNKLLRFSEALPYLQQSSGIFPTSWLSAFELSRAFLANHEYEKALQQANRAESLAADRRGTIPLHVVRGYALMGLKRYDEASIEFEAFISSRPNAKVTEKVRQTLSAIKVREAQRDAQHAPLAAHETEGIGSVAAPQF
jgi:tetratricopeptide (TPR) repeat protein